MRAFADHCAATAATYEFLVANGVKFQETPPDNVGAHSTGNSAPRENHAVWTEDTGLASSRATIIEESGQRSLYLPSGVSQPETLCLCTRPLPDIPFRQLWRQHR